MIAMLPHCGNRYFVLVHADGFDGARVYTNTAIHTGTGVHNSLLIGHLDSFTWALTDARFATGTLFGVYYCCHW